MFGGGRHSRPANKLILSWKGGNRDSEYALALMDDLRGRLANKVQLTRDGHKAYLQAVEEAFGADIDGAMLVKLDAEPPTSPEAARRYSPSECVGARKERSPASRTRSISARAAQSGRT